MGIKIINFIFGTVQLKITGTFPERILNIANQSGVFLQDIEKDEENSITFKVSRKGADMLLKENLPPNLELMVVKRDGIPGFLQKNRHRKILFVAPLLILILLLFSTQFIWNVNIIDADPKTEERLLKELKELGVKKGALKFTIDQTLVKNRLLNSDDSLLWVWVDIKGASAIVRYANRTPIPDIFSENDTSDIYSLKDGIVTSITATTGMARVKVGDEIHKGQLLIEGVMPKNSEENKFIRAGGTVFANVWEEKEVIVPKKNEIRTPSGEKTEHLSIKIKNFTLKLYINSSILYPNYDIIVDRRTLSFAPVTFIKEEYTDVSVTYEDNDINASLLLYKEDFINTLKKEGYRVTYTEYNITDVGDSYKVIIRALCEEMVAIERRIPHGEDYTGTLN